MAAYFPGLIYGLIWLVLAFGLGWPIAACAALLYVFFIPFTACFGCLEKFTSFLETLMKLPFIWASKAKGMKSICDCGLNA